LEKIRRPYYKSIKKSKSKRQNNSLKMSDSLNPRKRDRTIEDKKADDGMNTRRDMDFSLPCGQAGQSQVIGKILKISLCYE
jgi:hypothetical protein